MYYFKKDGREIGPVGADKLVNLFEDGQVRATDLVRVDGTATWLAAAQVVPSLSGPSRLPRVGRTHVYGSPAPVSGTASAAATPLNPEPARGLPGGDPVAPLAERSAGSPAFQAPVPGATVVARPPPTPGASLEAGKHPGAVLQQRAPATVRVESKPTPAGPGGGAFDETVKDALSPFSALSGPPLDQTLPSAGFPKSRTVPSADYLRATGGEHTAAAPARVSTNAAPPVVSEPWVPAHAAAPGPAVEQPVAAPQARPDPSVLARTELVGPELRTAPGQRAAGPPTATAPVGSPAAAAEAPPVGAAPALSPAFRSERATRAVAGEQSPADGPAAPVRGIRDPARLVAHGPHRPRAHDAPLDRHRVAPSGVPRPPGAAQSRFASLPGWDYLHSVTGGRPWVLLVAAALIVAFALVATTRHFTTSLQGDVQPPGTKVKTRTELTLGAGRAVIRTGSHTATGTASIRMLQTMELLAETADRFRSHYVEDARERVLSLRGAPDLEQRSDGPLAGVVVVFQRDGEGWKRSLRGTDAPTADQELRMQSLEPDLRALYPAGRSWTGTSWPVDARLLCASLGVLDECEGEAFMIFQRFVTLRGERCAHLTYSVELATEYDGMKLQMTLTGDLYRSIERSLDVQNQAEGTFTLTGGNTRGKAGRDRMGGLVELSGPVELTQTRTRTGR